MKYFYPAIFSHDAEKGTFAAVFPDIPGCQAFGRTMDETASRARNAMAASLLEMEEKEIPFLRTRDFYSAAAGMKRSVSSLWTWTATAPFAPTK